MWLLLLAAMTWASEVEPVTVSTGGKYLRAGEELTWREAKPYLLEDPVARTQVRWARSANATAYTTGTVAGISFIGGGVLLATSAGHTNGLGGAFGNLSAGQVSGIAWLGVGAVCAGFSVGFAVHTRHMRQETARVYNARLQVGVTGRGVAVAGRW